MVPWSSFVIFGKTSSSISGLLLIYNFKDGVVTEDSLESKSHCVCLPISANVSE